jgi:fermentation-respiration switch protein FrsA (DUF1100 family)
MRSLLVVPLLVTFVVPASALEVTRLRAPHAIRLSNHHLTRAGRIALTIRNDGGAPATFADASALAAAVGLVAAAAQGPIACPVLGPEVSAPKHFPLMLPPGRKRAVEYRATFDCAPDPDTKADWTFTAGAKAATTDVVDRRAGTAYQLPGRYAVGTTQLMLVDASRPTMPNGTYPGAPDRSLPTIVWYPADAAGTDVPVAGAGKPFPLVVFSHALGSTADQSVQYTSHLASHGYVVVAPAYPLSTLLAPGGPTVADTPAQAGDVSFLIDTFLGFSADPANRFAGAIDGERIAATGHSGGGITTLVVAYDAGVRDPRIKAAIPLAPPSCWFQQGWFGAVTVPLLILQGDADLLVDFTMNAHAIYERANPPKSLVRIAGGNHIGFADFGEQLDDTAVCALFPDPTSLTAGIMAMIASLGGAADHVVFDGCTVSGCTGDAAHIDGHRQVQIAKQAATAFLEMLFRDDKVAERYFYDELAATSPDLTHDFTR